MTTLDRRPPTGAGRRPEPADWNATDRPFPRDAGLAALFAARAAERPGAEALAWDGGSATYGELAAAAGRLAARLRRRGVGAETGVGLLLDPSPETVVATLAVLEAGGFYVPLDPAYPQARIELMLRDAGCRLVVATRATAGRACASGVPCLWLDGDGEDDGEGDGEELPAGAPAAGPAARRELGGDALAYVMYTSGSTGTPKGVAVTHRNVARLVLGAEYVRFGPGETFLQLAPTTFDAATLEIWGPLLTGGRLAIPAPGPLSVDELGAAIARFGVTTLWLTAGLFHQVVETRIEALAPVRQLLAGGDVLAPASVARVLRELPGTALVNGYGPTESTTFTCCHRASPDDGGGPVPIGRPIANTRAHVLDGAMRPAAVGEAGELYAGGEGVARGYVGRPAQTAERFVPDPFVDAPGARLYRTGDLARRRPDGALDFLGRRDAQVKIRGFRVEPGEVEAVLGALPGVAAAAVVVREDYPGDRRLVAYAVPAASARPAPERLAADLAERLPAHLVPAAFVLLDALPLTSNGKVDRRALPAPGRERPELETPYAAPASTTEAEVAELWAELLGLDRVGIDDSLFDLGGHSLTATRIAARLAERHRVGLPVVDVLLEPTARALAARLDELAGRSGGEAAPPLVRAPRDRRLPLTFQQEQVWFLRQLAPESLAYNFQSTLRLAGPLSRRVLARALTEIVRRHEVLRTAFVDRGGGAEQVVGEPWAARVPAIDLAGLAPGRRAAEGERLVARLVRHRFDPERPPLVRWALVRHGAEDHELVQVEHHFVHDGWSVAVFLGELEALYAAFAAGRPSPLPELPVQLADFALWQRRLLAEGHLDDQLAWWREHLADLPPPLELPADRPRPREQSFRGDRLDVEVPADLYRDLRDLARREGVTLFVLLTAAFEVLLARWTGQDEMLLGTGVANRRLAESELLIGMIVNTLVLRADLSGDPSFRRLLGRVRRAVLDLQARPDVPLERLVADLQPDRDLSRNPLFGVLFSFHDAPVPDLDFGGGLAGAMRERHNGSAKADLNVVVKPRAEQRVGRATRGADDEVLEVFWELSTDLFERSTVERMWRAWLRLLRQAVAAPDTRLSAFDLLGEEERRAVLHAWNDTDAPLPAEPIHHRVAAAAEERPDAAAVVGAEGRTVSYGELAGRARRLAAELARYGVGPGGRVAICSRRTPEAVAAVLGAVEAGAAYVPLDPASPPARLAATVADCAAAAVLTDAETAPVLARLPEDVTVLPLDGELPPADGFVPPPLGLDDLAYVVYTSGSTGAPKGVAVPHRGLANLVAWHLATYRLGPGDRCPHLAGPAFDASVWELWPVLAAGAELHLPPDEVRADPERLAAWLLARGITVGFLPTPLAEGVVPLDWPADAPLRALLTGGDALHRRPRPGLPFRLVNHYGPTESSVVATAGEVRPAARDSTRRPPPLGRPIANTRGYVLDAAGSPAPPGVPGELWIGGAGLAHGYVGRPSLTADRFRPDPFAAETGAEAGGRLYRTGDRVRWLADGRLEFLGRTDDQVKVRGVRIELGEVETVLASVPGVAACAVLALDAPSPDGVAEKRLVAWWQAAAGVAAEPDERALRDALARRLPEPMVPARFVRVDELPLTANGKVDRRALPAPEEAAETPAGFVPAEGELEELIVELWGEQLGAARIGRGDHFFRLGGHSLAATRVVHRLRDLLEMELPVAAIFDRPVLADLAAEIELRLAAEPAQAAAAIAAAGRVDRGAGAAG